MKDLAHTVSKKKPALKFFDKSGNVSIISLKYEEK